MTEPEYAISGTYMEFNRWWNADRDARRHVIYLTAERAVQHTTPGKLHRIGTWETSPALEGALKLEAPR